MFLRENLNNFLAVIFTKLYCLNETIYTYIYNITYINKNNSRCIIFLTSNLPLFTE